jgi:hypothetical protein
MSIVSALVRHVVAIAVAALAGLSMPFVPAGGARTEPVIDVNGVRLVLPADWRRVASAGRGAVTDPRTILVVGTTGVRPRSPRSAGCQIAAYRIPPTGAAVVIVRWQSVSSAGGGPWTPGRAPLLQLRSVHRPSFECFAGRGAVADVLLGAHPYQVNVLVGARASARRVAAALAVGRSFDLVR